jgi:hypothetical protein
MKQENKVSKASVLPVPPEDVLTITIKPKHGQIERPLLRVVVKQLRSLASALEAVADEKTEVQVLSIRYERNLVARLLSVAEDKQDRQDGEAPGQRVFTPLPSAHTALLSAVAFYSSDKADGPDWFTAEKLLSVAKQMKSSECVMHLKAGKDEETIDARLLRAIENDFKGTTKEKLTVSGRLQAVKVQAGRPHATILHPLSPKLKTRCVINSSPSDVGKHLESMLEVTGIATWAPGRLDPVKMEDCTFRVLPTESSMTPIMLGEAVREYLLGLPEEDLVCPVH